MAVSTFVVSYCHFHQLILLYNNEFSFIMLFFASITQNISIFKEPYLISNSEINLYSV